MKKIYSPIKRFQLLSLLFVALILAIPLDILGQKGNGNNKEVNILVSCVEYIGDGQLKVHFGYENPSNKTIVIAEDGSVVIYNHGQAIKAGLYVFEPGVKEKAFSQDFDHMDEVEWSVTLPSGNVKTVTANINYNDCSGDGLPIIPGYSPPEGGKEYDSKIGAELTALYEAFNLDPNFSDAPKDIFQIRGSEVLVEVVANSTRYDELLASLSGLFTIETSDPALNRATGWVEIADLLLYNAMDALHYGRPVFPGVGNAVSHYLVPATGLTKSQGDFAMHSDFARLGYAIDGTGVKIGVLSNSYDTQLKASQNVVAGDLPGVGNIYGKLTPVHVLKDINPVHGTLSDEGRAMLQIVHDIAPGAELAFRTGYLGEKDMALGIRELANAGADVIVDDLSYITEPFFRDGIITQTIDSVVNEGVTFFSSAGNFGRASYSGVFDSEAAPATISGTAHDFSGSGDIFQGVLLHEGSYTLVLQWDDGSDITMNTTTTDLDLFLSDDAGFSLLGFNRENVGGFPIEVVPFSVIGDSVAANIVIARASGPDVPVTFKYILFRGGSQFEMLEYGDGGSSTIVGHPNAEGAISVGAVRFDKNPVYNPGDFPVPVIMSFSSIGGTPVDGVVRAKPDITAPNGVNTTVDLGNGDWVSPIDPDVLYPNFFGTSASSPHAAGMAALLIEGKAKFDGDTALTPEYIRTVMKATALEMEDEGGAYNYVSGSGFIQAHKALMTFAQPSPYVQNLIVTSEGDVPGQEITPFSFTITGDFFTDSTQVLFRGDTLDSGVVVVDGSTITVDHGGFIGNPDIQIYNPPISNFGSDGGVSEEINFSSQPVQKIVITAHNRVKNFGEEIPDDSASFVLITVGGDSLNFEEALQDTLMLQAEVDRLKGLAYTIPANDVSDAGQYPILPSLYPEVDTVTPAEIDLAISEKYIVEFKSGNLTIEKLGLTITPMNTSLVYGESLPENGFQFLYQIGDSSVVITNPDSILQSVQQEHLDALTNEIALVRGVALVNGIPLIRGTALVNGVTMLRGIALVNGVEVKVEVEGSDTTVYVAGEPLVNGGSLVRGVALVNGRPFVSMTEIVRGVALVNGSELNFADGYMSLDDDPVANGIPVLRGVALVNGLNSRGIALVNGHTVEVDENGITRIDNVAVPTNGIALVNGIPVIRGTALVNSSLISRGVALVNGLEVVIENGVPTGRGIALINGLPTQRGIALVNGLPLIRGTALVNNLEVHVDDGEVSQVFENGILVNGLTLNRGIALVNEVALVNGSQLHSRGTALVNGIALVNDEGPGEEVVNLANMNFMASSTALANGLNSVRGVALVNGVESEDGEALKVAAGTVQEDGSIVFENGFSSRGIALVNGLNYVRGTALVNGSTLRVRGTALVNGSTINDNSNNGSILVFDATELGDTTDNVGFTPISFITGTTVGQHWIVPGTYISNNFDISYGLGTLTIDPADLTITAEDKSKTFGEEDPALTYTDQGLLGEDTLSGALIREVGEDVADYAILQGSVTAGENYKIHYDSATLSILPASMTVSITAEDKVYDGTRTAIVALSDNRLSGSELDIAYSTALFDTKHVGEMKEVTVLGLSVTGADAGNYVANTEATTTADISVDSIDVTAVTDSKTYNGTTSSGGVPEVDLLADGDEVSVVPVQVFASKNVGSEKVLSASGLVISDGNGGNNYAVSYVNDSTGNIDQLAINVTAVTDTRTYDGTTSSVEEPVVDPLMDGDVVSIVPVQVYDNKNAGTGKSLIASGLVINDGNEGGNYAVTYVNVTAGIISALGINVTAVTDSKTYDGTTGSEGEPIVDPLMIDDEVSIVPGQVFDNRNAGTGKSLIASGLVINDGNEGGNYAVTYVNATGSISELGINVTAVTDSKTYDGTTGSVGVPIVDPLVGGDIVTTVPEQVFDNRDVGIGKTLTASGLVISDGNGGNNYNVSYVQANSGQVDALAINVTAVTDSKVYDGFTTSFGVPVVDPLMDGDFASNVPVQLFDNKNAGTGKALSASGLNINDGNGGNNYVVSYVDDFTGVITPKPLTVTAIDPFLYIREGDPLPVFAFTYMGWIPGDAGNEGYTVLRDTDGAVYDQSSEESAGSYTVTPAPSNGNYAFTFETGTLHVNPSGPGTRVVKPVLNCIEEVGRGSGIYIANFEYKNENDVAVYIPEGDDNLLTGTGIDWENFEGLPTMFEPGGGTFTVFFDGSDLSWTVNSRDGDQKVSNAANANSSSTKCKGNSKKTASVSGSKIENELVPDLLVAYPNPVMDKLHLTMRDIENYRLIQLYDFTGRSYPITSIDKQTNKLEIDMVQLSAGSYFIRVIMEDDSFRVVQIIKY